VPANRPPTVNRESAPAPPRTGPSLAGTGRPQPARGRGLRPSRSLPAEVEGCGRRRTYRARVPEVDVEYCMKVSLLKVAFGGMSKARTPLAVVPGAMPLLNGSWPGSYT
jgi:hypothetical protein